MKTAFLFPGQGAQVVGMGRDFAESFACAAKIFENANEIVGYDLRKLCFEGPEEELNSTVVSQPAIFTVSAAILEAVRDNSATSALHPDVTAGLSLGEYTALYAAGAISFEDGLILVQKRGKAMQAAADASDGSMVSIIGLDEQKVSQLCAEAGEGRLLIAANFNCPGQIVISGNSKACQAAVALAPKYGAIKAVPLKVAGAFHTEMMAPAAKNLGRALADCEIKVAEKIKVIANVDARYYNNPQQVRQGLVNQLIMPIRWQKCMEKLLADGVKSFYEIGPGRVLTGLMKRIHRKTKVVNLSKAESVNILTSEVAAG